MILFYRPNRPIQSDMPIQTPIISLVKVPYDHFKTHEKIMDTLKLSSNFILLLPLYNFYYTIIFLQPSKIIF